MLNNYFAIMYWFLILFFLDNSILFNEFFQKKIFLKLNKISFGIYSFHWPVVCSIGSYLIMNTKKYQFLLCWLVSIIITFIISIIYHYIVECYIMNKYKFSIQGFKSIFIHKRGI